MPYVHLENEGIRMDRSPSCPAHPCMAAGLLMLAIVCLTSGGCTLNQQGAHEVAATWEQHQSQGAEQAASYSRVPTTMPAETDAAAASTQPAATQQSAARLREYIILALQSNPDIRKAHQIARSKAQRIPQVTALPDPMLSTKTLPEPVRTAEGDNFFILGVSQKLPVPGKLDRAGRVALEETRMAIAEWDKTRQRVIADVKRVYFQIYVLDRTIEITRDNQDLLKGLIDAVRGQVAAGTRRQEDLLRAQVELSNLESELIALRQKRTAAAAMLNALLNRDPTTRVPSPEAFAVRQTRLAVKALFEKAVRANPELARLERQIERDKQAVELAKLAYWPDFTLGFEWMDMEPRDAFRPPRNPQTGRRPVVSRMSEDGSDNWAILFGFNLPIWFDKIEGGIHEARARLAASMHEYVSAKNMVDFRIDDALANVEAQRELAELFDSTIIPQARQTYEVSRAGYMAGGTDFQYVIDNWRKWLLFTIQYHRAIGQLERSVADLEQAIGLSLEQAEVSP
jgi:cobalt-zinc-cadmium efflux system outer membrane protein